MTTPTLPNITFCPGTGCAEASTCRFLLTPEVQRLADAVGAPVQQVQFARSMPCFVEQPRSRRSGDDHVGEL